MQQINIHGDNLGVVNTGTLGNISNNLKIISGHAPALAAQLQELTERVIASTTLDATQKQEAADLLNEVVGEAARPERRRRPRAIMNAIVGALSQLLSHSADFYTLWTAIHPHLK